MRHGASGRRSRNRGNGGGGRNRGGQNQRTQVFDSNGPDVRIRGTAHQIYEKYVALAKDATSSSDYVLAESYLQHAEHYQRMINSWNDSQDDNGQNERQGRRQQYKAQNEQDMGDENDLSLPSSIVGEKATKADTGVMEDA